MQLQSMNTTATAISIDSLRDRIGETVSLNGWLYNRRGSKGLAFLILRDGSGQIQCVVSREDIGEETWAVVENLTQESALKVVGTVRADERQIGGVELSVEGLTLISLAEEYPITKKEHGIEFLMNHRHLWLRSQKQWAVLRIRNRVAMGIHEFFQQNGGIKRFVR